MDNAQLQKEINEKMNKTMATLDHDLSGLRTGRASPNLLDPVVVEAYGSRVPISQVASINVAEARLLTIQVWDAGLTKTVEKAIANANLGLNCSSEGQLIRIPLPPLSSERRAEMAKLAYKYGENAKVALRNIRRDIIDNIKKLEKDHKISEDDMHKYSDEVQKITDNFVKSIDEKVINKEKEITLV